MEWWRIVESHATIPEPSSPRFTRFRDLRVKRIAELDSLRGLAAIAIVVFHLNPQAFFGGWTGVDLFFVLSGYLISGIILRHGNEKGFLGRFYMRRGLRIWPIYYLALAALIVIIKRMPNPLPLDSVWYYLTYTQNVPLYWKNTAPTLRPFDHTWTLALEEQFYLIWPALVLLAGRKRIIPVCLATIALSWMAREGGYLTWSATFSERTLLGRCDGFALGGLLAALLVEGKSTDRRIVAGLGLTLVLSLSWIAWGMIAMGDPVRYLGLPTPARPSATILAVGVVYFGIVGLTVCFAGTNWLIPLRFPPLAYLGKISYGLYLYHYPLYWIIDGYTFVEKSQPWSVRIEKLGLTLLVAMLSWHLIESPILKLKDHFAYRAENVDSPLAAVVE